MPRSPSPQPWSAQDAGSHTPSHHKFPDICFYVGQNKETHPFLVDPRIAIGSPYLRTFMTRRSRSSETGPIYLPVLDPKAFEAYLYWLCAGYVPFPPRGSEPADPRERSLSWIECYPLLAAHVFGANIGDAAFMDHILNELDRWLLPVQQPHLEILEWVIGRTETDTRLTEFILDRMFGTDEGVKQLLHILIQRADDNIGEREALPAEGNRCRYHVHGEGGVCRTEPRHLQRTLENGNRISIHEEDSQTPVEVYENFLREIEAGASGVAVKKASSFRIRSPPLSTRAEPSRFSTWRNSVRGQSYKVAFKNLRRSQAKAPEALRRADPQPSKQRPLSLNRSPSGVFRLQQLDINKPLPPTPTPSSSESSSDTDEGNESYGKHLHSENKYPHRLSLIDGSAVMPRSPIWRQPAWTASTRTSSCDSMPTIGSVMSGRPFCQTPERRKSHAPLVSHVSSLQPGESQRSSVFWTRPASGISRVSQMTLLEEPPTGPTWPPALSPKSILRKPVQQPKRPVELEADRPEVSEEKIPADEEEEDSRSAEHASALNEEEAMAVVQDEGLVPVEGEERTDAKKVRWEDTY
ncbi:hypothetical protein K491DRAFT_681021 [Lophiostoma macrostomum CBS 122681]|uniref:BTB domain-containing protein n=1 Tax=Lophiostoma macrostomum CBS 122681 TaxID=1314788 RepID=A0A6A6T1S6_9PLEO|nr:hypothetical protein K491DRAFT_681021 [Lophiostoma macrostomum CBS 122681]